MSNCVGPCHYPIISNSLMEARLGTPPFNIKERGEEEKRRTITAAVPPNAYYVRHTKDSFTPSKCQAAQAPRLFRLRGENQPPGTAKEFALSWLKSLRSGTRQQIEIGPPARLTNTYPAVGLRSTVPSIHHHCYQFTMSKIYALHIMIHDHGPWICSSH